MFQTPEANTDSTQESYFQLQIFPGGREISKPSLEVARAWGKFLEKNNFLKNGFIYWPDTQ